jgi:hypothetical protein
MEELAHVVYFLGGLHKTKAQLKLLKSKYVSSQKTYQDFLENFEAFTNLNIELTIKIEQLESSATPTTNESLI